MTVPDLRLTDEDGATLWATTDEDTIACASGAVAAISVHDRGTGGVYVGRYEAKNLIAFLQDALRDAEPPKDGT